jgi:hypothetical protein
VQTRRSSVRPFVAAGGAIALFAAAALPAFALSVTVDGQPTDFNPPPIERAGRVFVPLRGVFERLGASVVYENGTINATSHGRQISLHIGSTQATVDGQPRIVDVAPFVIGASTYVPLRFVSEALGAGVNYDATNQIVALNTRGGPGGGREAVMQGPPPGGPPPETHVLTDLEPGRRASVDSRRPTISATFAQPVDPNSVRVQLDGLDVTGAATRSGSGFIYAPPSPLQSMPHVVSVTGTVQGGAPFTETWRFTTGSEPDHNVLRISSPAEGDTVGGDFTVTGHTVPNALVHVDAGSAAHFAGESFAFGSGNFTNDTTAGPDGNFSIPVHVRTFPSASIGVTVTSTDPRTRESAQKKLQLSTV